MFFFSRTLIIYSTQVWAPKHKKRSQAYKKTDFCCLRKQNKLAFWCGHYIMSVIELLLALIYKVHPFWKKSYQQVHLCVEFK